MATYSVDPNTGLYKDGGFKNALNQLADPTVVTLKIKDGTGAITSPVPVKDAVGLYHFDLDTTGKPGRWTYEWIGTGAVQAINPSNFKVEAAPL